MASSGFSPTGDKSDGNTKLPLGIERCSRFCAVARKFGKSERATTTSESRVSSFDDRLQQEGASERVVTGEFLQRCEGLKALHRADFTLQRMGGEIGEEEATAWAGSGEGRKSPVTFGYARVKGLRDHPIEDYHVARTQSFDGDEIGLFAVYDGHAGTEVAAYLEQELFENILKHPNFVNDPKKTITEVYSSTDRRILDKGENNLEYRAGSTATTAFLLNNGKRLIVANVGDSRAVLARGGTAIELSVDHEPQKPEEREMVEAKGGEVSLSPLGGVYRVDKRLNMSRAFGDYTIKQHLSVAPDIWDNCLTEMDDFFIVASDGLWKVMNSQEAVDQVRAEDTAEAAAKALAASALRRGSRDDISCLVICLKAPRVNSTKRCS